MRPTRDVPTGPMKPEKYRTSVENNESLVVEDKIKWRTASGWTHWDLNPWKWTLEKETGLDYTFEGFISENNGSRNDGIPKLQGKKKFIRNFWRYRMINKPKIIRFM